MNICIERLILSEPTEFFFSSDYPFQYRPGREARNFLEETELGGEILAPSSIKADGEMFTDTQGPQKHGLPKAFTTDDIKRTVTGHVKAAKNAVTAGFDGVEFHGAHGYLAEQFLNPHVNRREDEYGGSVENRSRFILETIQAMVNSIGADKVGIRLSPYNTNNDQPSYDNEEIYKTYQYLTKELNRIGVQYIHVSMQDASKEIYQMIRENYSGTIIQCNGLTPGAAEEALNAYFADLTAFGRPFLGNPDFVERIKEEAFMNDFDPDALYTSGPEGYTDYSTLKLKTA